MGSGRGADPAKDTGARPGRAQIRRSCAGRRAESGVPCRTARGSDGAAGGSPRTRVAGSLLHRVPLCRSIGPRVLEFADALDVDDPQAAAHVAHSKRFVESAERGDEEVRRRMTREPYDGESRPLAGPEVPGVGEPEVEGDQASPLGTTGFDQCGVGRPLEVLRAHRRHVVTARAKEGRAALADVLVELQSRSAFGSGTSM